MPPASFRPHLTMDPLPLAVCLLWSYRTRDFHPLDYTHAGRTPLSGCAGLPPIQGAEQPALSIERLMRLQPRGALLCPRLRGKGGAVRHQRGKRRNGKKHLCLIFPMFPSAGWAAFGGMGSLSSPPPIRLRRTSYSGGRITSLRLPAVSCSTYP